MRFKVPQFIDIEDKIFGPLTFKQFMYVAGGAGLIYISYVFFPTYLAIPFIIIFGGLGFSLAFVEINKKPFIYVMEAYIRYTLDSKIYLWRKVMKKGDAAEKEEVKSKDKASVSHKLTDNKLQELSWGLNIIEEAEK
ncbi:MAG: hypothetical protein ACI88L_000311 [Candidatus Paceibacteria bacterium]|jgi:hypothetical protein